MTQTTLLAVAGSLALFLIALRKFLGTKSDGREPPPVSSSIPFIGHIFGLMRHKIFYYQMLSKQTTAPVFSIPILGSKIYVVASPKLISTVQRNTKALAFEPIIASASKAVAGCSDETQAIMDTNIDGSEGPRGYVLTFTKAIHPPLQPGPALDDMNRIMIQDIEGASNQLATGPKRINLFEWLRHELTMATTNAVYGPGNPYVNKAIEEAFWDFEANLMMLLVNVKPSITARAGLKVRSTVANAFSTYFSQNAHLKGSSLVQARFNHSREYDVPISDIALFEVGGSLALLANTFPTAYWMLIYIYSHEGLLRDCRDEVSRIDKTTQQTDGTTSHNIDMTSIKANCPIIAAVLQEVLRHTAVGATTRQVTEDTLLGGYLLKKGCTLVTPANILHTDENIWGENTHTFDHTRFLKAPGKKIPNPVAFRAFGGGATLCPGRHFATTEVLAIATMFIARFEMGPVGDWPKPDRRAAEMWTQILSPDHGFEVEVSEREKVRGDKWSFDLTESEMLLAMAAEDLGAEADT